MSVENGYGEQMCSAPPVPKFNTVEIRVEVNGYTVVPSSYAGQLTSTGYHDRGAVRVFPNFVALMDWLSRHLTPINQGNEK